MTAPVPARTGDARTAQALNDVDYLHCFADDAHGCAISASNAIHAIADRYAALAAADAVDRAAGVVRVDTISEANVERIAKAIRRAVVTHDFGISTWQDYAIEARAALAALASEVDGNDN